MTEDTECMRIAEDRAADIVALANGQAPEGCDTHTVEDYLNDAYEALNTVHVEVDVNRPSEVRSAEILLAWGGPNIWLKVDNAITVEVYWGCSHACKVIDDREASWRIWAWFDDLWTYKREQ